MANENTNDEYVIREYPTNDIQLGTERRHKRWLMCSEELSSIVQGWVINSTTGTIEVTQNNKIVYKITIEDDENLQQTTETSEN